MADDSQKRPDDGLPNITQLLMSFGLKVYQDIKDSERKIEEEEEEVNNPAEGLQDMFAMFQKTGQEFIDSIFSGPVASGFDIDSLLKNFTSKNSPLIDLFESLGIKGEDSVLFSDEMLDRFSRAQARVDYMQTNFDLNGEANQIINDLADQLKNITPEADLSEKQICEVFNMVHLTIDDLLYSEHIARKSTQDKDYDNTFNQLLIETDSALAAYALTIFDEPQCVIFDVIDKDIKIIEADTNKPKKDRIEPLRKQLECIRLHSQTWDAKDELKGQLETEQRDGYAAMSVHRAKEVGEDIADSLSGGSSLPELDSQTEALLWYQAVVCSDSKATEEVTAALRYFCQGALLNPVPKSKIDAARKTMIAAGYREEYIKAFNRSNK